MSARLGRTPTFEKITGRFFRYGIYNDVADYIQKCDRCQRQSSLPPNVRNKMHSVPGSPHVMKQVGLDLCSLLGEMATGQWWMATATLLSAIFH